MFHTTTLRAFAVAISALLVSPVVSADESALQPGAYDVEITLALPHVPNEVVTKTQTICVTSTGTAETRGLRVLSGNELFSHCPISAVSWSNEALTFDIFCAGRNAAEAHAAYAIAPQSFEGRIKIKMGGKNMTMTEKQRGRRTGECEAPKS